MAAITNDIWRCQARHSQGLASAALLVLGLVLDVPILTVVVGGIAFLQHSTLHCGLRVAGHAAHTSVFVTKPRRNIVAPGKQMRCAARSAHVSVSLRTCTWCRSMQTTYVQVLTHLNSQCSAWLHVCQGSRQQVGG